MLLLHGYPQTHVMWHKIVARLARRFTITATDLRGYGDSGKPASGPETSHLSYSKRAMFAATRGHMVLVGTPSMVADSMQYWFENGACDGFNLIPPMFPGDFESFVDLVVPELQRRGIYRKAYEGHTLRDQLGLSVPASRYAGVVAAG